MAIPWRNTAARFGGIAQLFHWTIVALIITEYVLGLPLEDLPEGAKKAADLALHKSVGMTVLVLALLRVIWSFANPRPEDPPAMPSWQRLSSRALHVLLYVLLFAMPLSGWLMQSAGNIPVSWFGLFTFSDLIEPDRAWFKFFYNMHETMHPMLFFLSIFHALAALKHHFFDRDNVLRRMLPMRLK